MVSWNKLPENDAGSLACIFKIIVIFSSLEANSIFTFQKEAYNLYGRDVYLSELCFLTPHLSNFTKKQASGQNIVWPDPHNWVPYFGYIKYIQQAPAQLYIGKVSFAQHQRHC